jgi:hypothetical protein
MPHKHGICGARQDMPHTLEVTTDAPKRGDLTLLLLSTCASLDVPLERSLGGFFRMCCAASVAIMIRPSTCQVLTSSSRRDDVDAASQLQETSTGNRSFLWLRMVLCS